MYLLYLSGRWELLEPAALQAPKNAFVPTAVALLDFTSFENYL